MNPNVHFLNELANTLNLAIVEELLVIYFEQMQDSKIRYNELLKNFNAEEVIQISHKMKSSSRNIGANDLAELFSLMEKNPQCLNELNYKKMDHLFITYQASIKEWMLRKGI